jgi:ABC-type multidrug transport system fused ATPase/permease subunit
LSIVKVPYYISFILTIIFIILIGITNIYFSYFTLIDIIDEAKLKQKRSIKNTDKKKEEEEIEKKRVVFYNDLCKNLNIFNIPFIICEIIIHQILIYRSLGGIVNIIGEFNYDSSFIFLSDTYWKELSMKFVVNIIVCLLLLCPLCLKMNSKIIDTFPIIGFYIILFIVLGVFFQFFYYFINYCMTEFNYRDLSIYPNKRESFSKCFQSLAILFYCYSGHNGFFDKIPMEKNLKKPEIRRKEFKLANILNMFIYFIFSCLGFLSVPKDVVDIVTEKKRFWNKDIIMTISRILLLPFCAFKIIINFDRFKSIIFYKKEKIGEKTNAIFVYATLLITCICASLYQNIVGYITIIGGFFVPIPTFLIPQIKLKKYLEKEYKFGFKKCRIIFRIIFTAILWTLGIIGGIFGIIDIFKGDL